MTLVVAEKRFSRHTKDGDSSEKAAIGIDLLKAVNVFDCSNLNTSFCCHCCMAFAAIMQPLSNESHCRVISLILFVIARLILNICQIYSFCRFILSNRFVVVIYFYFLLQLLMVVICLVYMIAYMYPVLLSYCMNFFFF